MSFKKLGYAPEYQSDVVSDLDQGGGGGGVYYLPRDLVVDPNIDPPADPIEQGDTTETVILEESPTPPPPGLPPMESYITLYGGDLSKPIAGVLKWWNKRDGEIYAILSDTHFHVWADHDIENVVAEISAPGFSTAKIPAADLLYEQNVILKKPIPIGLILAAIGALIAFAKKRKKEVGKVTTSDVMPFLIIGGGLLAFSVVKQILEGLGIWDSKDTKELDNTATDPGSWWSPMFWRSKPDNVPYSYTISTATATAWADELYDAFGPFNDDEDAAIAIFKRMRTKANASFFAEVFALRTGEDLLTFLRGGSWPQDRLSDEDVNVINNYIDHLPNY